MNIISNINNISRSKNCAIFVFLSFFAFVLLSTSEASNSNYCFAYSEVSMVGAVVFVPVFALMHSQFACYLKQYLNNMKRPITDSRWKRKRDRVKFILKFPQAFVNCCAQSLLPLVVLSSIFCFSSENSFIFG